MDMKVIDKYGKGFKVIWVFVINWWKEKGYLYIYILNLFGKYYEIVI